MVAGDDENFERFEGKHTEKTFGEKVLSALREFHRRYTAANKLYIISFSFFKICLAFSHFIFSNVKNIIFEGENSKCEKHEQQSLYRSKQIEYKELAFVRKLNRHISLYSTKTPWFLLSRIRCILLPCGAKKKRWFFSNTYFSNTRRLQAKPFMWLLRTHI